MDHPYAVVGGDAHKHTITLAALDATGETIAVDTFAVTPEGMLAVSDWLDALGLPVTRVGIEGSASWGKPVSAFLAQAGHDV